MSGRSTRPADEFDGDAWDPSRWATDHWTSGGGGLHFEPDRATVHGGRLHIEVRRPSGSGPWRAGLLHSAFAIGADTYLEVRAKMIPFAANVNSAIWVQQETGPGPDGDLNVEIDLQEYHQDNRHAGRQNVRSSAHLWRWTPSPPPHADLTPKLGRSFPTGADLDRGFHRYGLERRNGEVNLYFEGTLLRQLHREIENPEHRELLATQDRRLILACNGLAPGLPEAEGDMEIDYVRVYTAGRT
ncbi:glycoside hydrolase family 16 protein [Pseudonocardia sp. C8]|uniref:glycoside hydrolase family 16 protein n=1 Tax=Pseudonocardia sp. C8 TaxID=2762759 RepID=UPI00164246B3|nr:glycoside hydrolase family 16 protein [Pseudonocardia sp. C8]MBC3194490.1 glycoside hydrolase family 16 protein [Pseudonocardia sp. C8]